MNPYMESQSSNGLESFADSLNELRMDSSQEDQSSKFPLEIPLEIPFPPGGYIEPNYHFYFKSDPFTVFQVLIKLLTSQAIDIVVNHSRYKIKCVTYSHYESLHFIVR